MQGKDRELDVRERDVAEIELHERGGAVRGVRGIVARDHARGVAVVVVFVRAVADFGILGRGEDLFSSLGLDGNREQPDRVRALRAGRNRFPNGDARPQFAATMV